MAYRFYLFYQMLQNANLSLLIEYSIRVEAYIPELPADNTDVKMTAFINDAANANPAF